MVIVMKAGAEQQDTFTLSLLKSEGLNYKASADSGHRARCHYGDWAEVLVRLWPT